MCSIVHRFQERYPVSQLCGLFGIHRSSYRAWRARPKELSVGERNLWERVTAAHRLSNGSAGARSIAKMVNNEGISLQSLPFCLAHEGAGTGKQPTAEVPVQEGRPATCGDTEPAGATVCCGFAQ